MIKWLVIAVALTGCQKHRERAMSYDAGCARSGSNVFRVAYLYRGSNDREAMAKLREDAGCESQPAMSIHDLNEVAIIACCPE